jgi:hypothetical protein
MAVLIARRDWSQTPLGPMHTWPHSLRTTVGIMLNTQFPMFLFWGPEAIGLYNDAYRPSLGDLPALVWSTAPTGTRTSARPPSSSSTRRPTATRYASSAS